MTDFKFPRLIEADPRREKLAELLNQDPRPLWENGRIAVPHLPWTPALEAALVAAQKQKNLERGLERIEQVLSGEKTGLEALARKQGTPLSDRISRILIIANDGVERFNRGCEAVLFHHPHRVLGIRVDVPSAQMCEKLFPPEKSAKAVLLSDREAVTALLFSLVAD